jgi:hypothetical protein
MPAHAMNRLRAALTLALISLSCAANAQVVTTGVRYGVAPALDCKQTGKAAAQGSWIDANGVAVEGSPTRRMRLSFNDPVATDTIHVAMNKVGSRDLALVEIQDAKGGWHKAWEGQLLQAAPGFDEVYCFEQQLPQKQAVQALRLSFRAAPGQIEVNHAALLRR